jgi:integrase
MPKRSTSRLTKRVIDETKPGAFVWDSELRGFGLRVTPAGAKSFVVQYRMPSGKQGRTVVGAYPALTTDEAREIARERLGGVPQGRNPSATKHTLRTAPTLADLAGEYTGEYAMTRNLRPRTVKDARAVLRHALASLGATKVIDITTTDIRRVHGELRKASGVYQANRLLAVLSKMFSLAAELGWRGGDNPCRSIKKFPEDQRWRNLSENEVGRLLDACDAYAEQGGRNGADAIRLLLFTGSRLQEVLKAEWPQFDLELGLWEKPSSHTKTKRQHRLELEGPALQLLQEMREREPDGRFLFPGEPRQIPDGKFEATPRADLKRPWVWIVREAALENVRLHDLRRTTASFMLSGGASLATVGKALGHTQATTTARYAHLSQTVQREELKRAGERMTALRGSSPGKGKVVAYGVASNKGGQLS